MACEIANAKLTLKGSGLNWAPPGTSAVTAFPSHTLNNIWHNLQKSLAIPIVYNRQLTNAPFAACDIHTASDQQICLVGCIVRSTNFFRRQDFQIRKSCLLEPVTQFSNCVMVLVPWSPPVERVADSVLIAWMSAEVDNFIQRPVDDRNRSQHRAKVTKRHQHFGGHPGCHRAQSAVDQFLPPLIATVQPDRILTSGLTMRATASKTRRVSTSWCITPIEKTKSKLAASSGRCFRSA